MGGTGLTELRYFIKKFSKLGFVSTNDETNVKGKFSGITE